MNSVIERVKTNFKKSKIILLVSLLIWTIAFVATIYGYRYTLGRESIGTLEYNYVEKLSGSRDARQIVDVTDGIDSISVRLEVYKKNNSNVTVEVIGQDSGKVYGSKTYKIKNVLGASYNTVGLSEPLNRENDKKIIVHIYTDDNSDAIGVWCAFNNAFGENNSMYVGNEALPGCFSLRLLYPTEMYKTITVVIVSVSAVFITLMILYVLLLEPKKEIIYTLMVLVFGLIFMFVVTPISGPDEEYHYRASLNVSNKFMGQKDPDMIVDEYIGYYDTLECNFNIGAVYRTVIEHFDDELEDLTNQPMYELNRGYTYNYDLCYFPQAIPITIARLFKLNFLKTYYSGRLGSLLFYTLCIYLALRKAPILKDLIGIAALLPINIQQAVCYSMDMWISALGMVIFACFLQWSFGREKITKSDFVFLLIVEALLAPTKIIYSLFILIFFFVPKERFYSSKHRMLVLILLMSPMIYYVGKNVFYKLLYAFMSPIYAEDIGTATTHEIKQFFSIQYIVSHPMETISIIYRTIRKDLKSWFAGAVGRYLSGLTLILPSIIANAMVALLTLSALVKEEKHMSIWSRLASVGICVLIGMLTMAVMLTGWTDVNDEYVQGIQGRYFTSFIPFIFCVLNNKKIYIPQKYSNVLLFSKLLLLFEIVMYMLSATFVY